MYGLTFSTAILVMVDHCKRFSWLEYIYFKFKFDCNCENLLILLSVE